MTIAQSITNTWPVTEVLLHGDPEVGYDDAKELAIMNAIRGIYEPLGVSVPTVNDVESGPLVVEEQVAGKAMLTLIDLAINYYMEKSRKAQSATSETGVSASETAHDRIDVLRRKKTEIQADIKAREGQVVAVIAPPVTPTPLSFFALAQAHRC